MKRNDTSRAERGPSQRQLQVAEEIRHGLAEILMRPDGLHEAVLLDRSVTVTEVRISPDLKNATAFVMPLGGRDLEEVLPALNRAAPWFRHQLGRHLRLRNIPRVGFIADESFDEAQKIGTILNEPAVREDTARGEHDDEEHR